MEAAKLDPFREVSAGEHAGLCRVVDAAESEIVRLAAEAGEEAKAARKIAADCLLMLGELQGEAVDEDGRPGEGPGWRAICQTVEAAAVGALRAAARAGEAAHWAERVDDGWGDVICQTGTVAGVRDGLKSAATLTGAVQAARDGAREARESVEARRARLRRAMGARDGDDG